MNRSSFRCPRCQRTPRNARRRPMTPPLPRKVGLIDSDTPGEFVTSAHFPGKVTSKRLLAVFEPGTNNSHWVFSALTRL